MYALTHAGIEAEGVPDDAEFRAACARRLPGCGGPRHHAAGRRRNRDPQAHPSAPRGFRVPVMMVTAKNSEIDIVTALDATAPMST